MSKRRLKNIFGAATHAKKGATGRDRILIFLLIAFGSMSLSSKTSRRAIAQLIGLFGVDKQVRVDFHGVTRIVRFRLRSGNESDYSIASEFLKGGYQAPDFVPDQIVDGGANIGLFSVLAADRFPSARLVLFEPDAENMAMAKINLAQNGIECECNQKGLWSRSATLYFRASGSRFSSLSGIIADSPPGSPVEVVGLSIGQNCWLKLDIEGSEYEVLPALLSGGVCPRWLSAELHFYDKRGSVLRELLTTHGYKIEGNLESAGDTVTIWAHRREDKMGAVDVDDCTANAGPSIH
jgi:FkbM family methyltransferase